MFLHPIFVQAEGLPVQGPVECNLPSNGTSSNSTGKVPDEVTRKSCYAQVSEALPRGIITPTTDLQFRSLFEEDEKQVGCCLPLLLPHFHFSFSFFNFNFNVHFHFGF